MPDPHLTSDEVATRGEMLYEREIRSLVEANHRGEFLVIDVNSGSYEMAPDDLTATQQLLVTHPNARIFGLRIGHPTAYRLGGRFVMVEE